MLHLQCVIQNYAIWRFELRCRITRNSWRTIYHRGCLVDIVTVSYHFQMHLLCFIHALCHVAFVLFATNINWPVTSTPPWPPATYAYTYSSQSITPLLKKKRGSMWTRLQLTTDRCQICLFRCSSNCWKGRSVTRSRVGLPTVPHFPGSPVF